MIGWPISTRILNELQTGIDKIIATAAITGNEEQTVIFLQPPNMLVATYLPVQMDVEGYSLPKGLLQLSAAEANHRVHRTAPDTIELEIIDGHMMGTMWELKWRPPVLPLEVGHQVQLDVMRATVLEVDNVGPTRLEFKFDRNLEDPSLRFVAWGEGAIKGIALPDINESILLSWSPAPGSAP